MKKLVILFFRDSQFTARKAGGEQEIVIYCIIIILLHTIAGIIYPKNFDIYFVLSTVFSVLILIITFIIFRDYIRKYIEKSKQNETYLIIGQIASKLVHNIHLEVILGYNEFSLLALKANNIDNAISVLTLQRELLENNEKLRKSVINSIQISKIEQECKPVNLKKTITSVGALTEISEDHYFGAKLIYNLLDVYADIIEIDIFLIIHGLITNAVEALNKINKREKIITISLTRQNKYAIIIIHDNGKGFETTNIDELKTNKQNGGIGLKLARDIIEDRYKGNIRLYNTPDGANVEIKLKESKMNKLVLKYLKILVVDDNDHTIKLLKLYFDQTVHDVDYAKNPEDAIRIIKGNEPKTFDLALIDYELNSSISGLDTAQIIKEYDKRIQIVIMTNKNDKETQEKIYAANNLFQGIDKWKDSYAMTDLLNQILSEKEKERNGEESIFSE